MKIIDYFKRIEKIIKKQKGTLLSSDLDKNGIPRTYLSMMVSEGKLERVERGVYVLPDSLEDEMFILQKKYPKLIYSHETALFLHQLSDRTPFEYSVTVSSGYKVVEAISNKSKVYYVKEGLHMMGVVEVSSSMGNPINIYGVERTICDLIRSRNRIDIQIFSDALKRVSSKKGVDFYLMTEYARLFRVEKILNTYLEVLLA
ncbi:MAG: type IV toxin-antitoxin system AbiEi family antitoxin domain-containing protein [Bacteroidia bacterium]|nr:type IV toxin-antitoxin system AbiEi family antitoxin domain-containing protein [Bacteroidia bacterium]